MVIGVRPIVCVPMPKHNGTWECKYLVVECFNPYLNKHGDREHCPGVEVSFATCCHHFFKSYFKHIRTLYSTSPWFILQEQIVKFVSRFLCFNWIFDFLCMYWKFYVSSSCYNSCKIHVLTPYNGFKSRFQDIFYNIFSCFYSPCFCASMFQHSHPFKTTFIQ